MSTFFPTVCSDSSPISFSLNSGQTPFKFDFEGYLVREANRCFSEINKVEVDKSSLFHIVSAYLYVNGHHDTLINLQGVHKLDKPRLIETLAKQGMGCSAGSSKSMSITQAIASESERKEDPEKTEAGGRSGIIGSIGSSLKSLFKKQSPKKDSEQSWSDTMDEKPRFAPLTSDPTAFFERSRIRRHVLNNRITEARELFKSIFGAVHRSDKTAHFFVVFQVLEFLALFQKSQQDSLVFAKQVFVGEIKNSKLSFVDQENKPQTFEVKVASSHRGAHVVVCDERCEEL